MLKLGFLFNKITPDLSYFRTIKSDIDKVALFLLIVDMPITSSHHKGYD
jgi:hypothetical protein